MIGGVIITVPIIFVEKGLLLFSPDQPYFKPTYFAFVVAGLTEEIFKFIVFFVLIWNNKEFNEKFDAMVYAVFISFGFAAVENVMYVFPNGLITGYLRATCALVLQRDII